MQPQLKKTLWIVVPSILFLCVVLVFSIIYSISDKNSGPAANPANANVIRVPDLDFAFVPPTDTWQQTDPSKLAPNAVMGFMRANPKMAFATIVTPLPPAAATITLDQLAQEIVAEIHKSFDSANLVITQQPIAKKINGIPGVLLTHRAEAGDHVPQAYVHWVGVSNGKAYHLLLFGLGSDEGAVLGESENMLNRFHPLSDFPASQNAVASSVQDFTSKKYQYVVRFNDPNWVQWQDVAKVADHAEVGFLNGNDTWMFVSALNIGNLGDDFNTILFSLARGMGVNITSNNVRALHANSAEGAIFWQVAPNPIGQGLAQHVYEVVRNKNMLFLAHAWTVNQQKVPMIFDEIQTKFSFPPEPPSAQVEMTAAEVRLFASLLNEIGVTYVRSNRPAQAVPYFDQALKVLPDKPAIVDNKAIAQLQANQARDARTTISVAMQTFPNEPVIKAHAAQINAELGDYKLAQDLYASVVNKSDFRSIPGADAVIVQYGRFLVQQNMLDKAKEVVGNYRNGSDASRAISLLYAMIMGKKGEHAAAIDLLEQLRKTAPTTSPTTSPAASTMPSTMPMLAGTTTMPSTAPTTLASAEPEADLLIVLGKEYNAVGRYNDALEIATDLLKRGVDAADAYLVKAGALAGTKKFADARTAIDAALQRNALSRESFDMQRVIADGLGQNDKALYAKPIEAVAIPQELLQGIPADPPASNITDAIGAYFVTKVGAIAFEAGKDYRSTELQRIKALTHSGAERVSSFEFRFDPTVEALYINKAEVTDSTGKVISSAKPEDSFLIDALPDDPNPQKKILHLSVPQFSPECTLDVLITRKTLSPPARMKFTRYFMSTPMLVERDAFVLRTPDSSQIKDAASNGPAKKTYGDAVCWLMDNPPIYHGESIPQEMSSYLPWLAIGDAKATWEQIGDEYLAKLKDVLVDDPECKALSARLTAGKSSEQEKLVAIAAYVQKEIANKAGDFTTSARVPRKPSDVIKDKSGDGKDQALLLYQLLRAAGFEQARLALVNRSDKVEDSLPSIEQFDHMVVCLPGSKPDDVRFIDCTEKDLSVESSTDTFISNKALVLQNGGSQVVEVPPLPADASTIKIKRDATMDVHAMLTIHDTMELSGPAAALWRSGLKSLTADEQKKQVHDVIARSGSNADITQLSISPLDDPQKPLVMDITYTMNDRFRQVQPAVIAGQLPAIWEIHWLYPPQTSLRLTPFYVRVPMKIQSEFALHLPDKVKLANPVNNDKVEGKFGTLTSNYTAKPNELDGTLEIHTMAGRFDKDVYNSGFVQNRYDLLNKSQPELDLQLTQ